MGKERPQEGRRASALEATDQHPKSLPGERHPHRRLQGNKERMRQDAMSLSCGHPVQLQTRRAKVEIFIRKQRERYTQSRRFRLISNW